MRLQAGITDQLRLAIVASLLMALSAWAINSPSAISIPTLTADSHTATAGFYHLKWRGDDLLTSTYELQEANNAAFTQPTTIYRGSDQEILISGQKNGRYFYRVRALAQGQPASAWSSLVPVTVQHHSLTRAFAFFAAGAAVFLATLILIILGARQTRQEGKLR
jgi:hypothetical protein